MSRCAAVMKKRAWTFTLMFAMLFTLLFSRAAFAAPSIEFTTNGNAQQYGANATIVVYGQIKNDGMALAGAEVIIKTTIDDASMFSTAVRSDANGFFNMRFNLPSSVNVGQTVKFSVSYGATASKEASVAVTAQRFTELKGAMFPAYSSTNAISQKVDPSVNQFSLVFQGNVNYFNNRSNTTVPVENLGPNTQNADCIAMYENRTGKKIRTAVSLIPNGGDDSVSYYEIDTLAPAQDNRKDSLNFSISESLKEDTVYEIVVSKELTNNSSASLGTDTVIYFKTASRASAPDDPDVEEDDKQSPGKPNVTGARANHTSSGTAVEITQTDAPFEQPLPPNTQALSSPFIITATDEAGNTVTFTDEKCTYVFMGDLSEVTNPNSIMVFVLVDDEWIYVPSAIDSITGEITVSTHYTGKFIIVNNDIIDRLTDLKEDKNFEPIKTMIAMGLIEGIPQADGTYIFGGEQNLLRAEFSVVLCGLLGLDPSKADITRGGGIFIDWDSTPEYAKPYMMVLYDNEILKGILEGGELYAGGDQALTVNQMIVFMCRAMGITYSQDESWYADAVNKLNMLNVIDTMIRDTADPSTRNEMAYTVGQLLLKQIEREL